MSKSPFQVFSVLLFVSSILYSFNTHAKSLTYVTVEEARIDKAQEQLPSITGQFSPLVTSFEQALKQATSQNKLKSVNEKFANLLWRQASEHLQSNNTFDDRPLYWARLQMAKLIRGNQAFRALAESQQQDIMFEFELTSRGLGQVNFSAGKMKKILVTGFDPFFLDRNIAQSNPSGIAALYLDNKVLEMNGEKVQVQSLVVPVRFADFDQGMIETMLSKYVPEVDMVATISMGREDFDLERFPGLRRSSKAPGNLNIFTGATAQNPLKPFLKGVEFTTPEFVEFSLPVKAMQKAKGPYKIIDNHKIETLAKGKFEPKTLAELKGETAVQGSGGGYLSNEISYRSIILRNKLNPDLPVGHIHTPRIKDWKYEEVKGIVLQIEDMLRHSIPAIK